MRRADNFPRHICDVANENDQATADEWKNTTHKWCKKEVDWQWNQQRTELSQLQLQDQIWPACQEDESTVLLILQALEHSGEKNELVAKSHAKYVDELVRR